SLTDDAGGAFQIDSSTGVVTVKDSSKLVDLGSSASITVQASEADDVGGPASRSEERRVGEAGGSRSASTASDTSHNTGTGTSANGRAVGITANSSDPGGETVAYSLTDDAGGAFQIDSSTGVVTVKDSSKLVDLGSSASITVQASEADDVGGPAS